MDPYSAEPEFPDLTLRKVIPPHNLLFGICFLCDGNIYSHNEFYMEIRRGKAYYDCTKCVDERMIEEMGLTIIQ